MAEAGRHFALYGHSMGALVAFEVTRLLRKRRAPPPMALFVAGCESPSAVSRSKRLTYDLPTPSFIAELKRLNGPNNLIFQHSDLLDLVLPVLRADFQICQTYNYDPDEPLDVPVWAFAGKSDKSTQLTSIENWKECTIRNCETTVLPGDHFFPLTSEDALISVIQNTMRQLSSCSWGTVSPKRDNRACRKC